MRFAAKSMGGLSLLRCCQWLRQIAMSMSIHLIHGDHGGGIRFSENDLIKSFSRYEVRFHVFIDRTLGNLDGSEASADGVETLADLFTGMTSLIMERVCLFGDCLLSGLFTSCHH